MNEFIFWNKHYEKFFDDLTISGINVNEALEENEDWIALPYIQKDDINNNKIYADCSIVEFEWKISGLKKVGYFYYSNEYLCYMIKWVSEYTSDVLFYDKYTMKNFKIIDTIQENKLGLIKE